MSYTIDYNCACCSKQEISTREDKTHLCGECRTEKGPITLDELRESMDCFVIYTKEGLKIVNFWGDGVIAESPESDPIDESQIIDWIAL